MIKIYGMPTCPDCAYVHDQIEGRESEFEYINIGEHVKYFKEFTALRDNDPAFDEVKKHGYLGIPCFVREDGSVTVIPEEVGLKTKPADGATCNLDGSGC